MKSEAMKAMAVNEVFLIMGGDELCPDATDCQPGGKFRPPGSANVIHSAWDTGFGREGEGRSE
jgi:hypothetical protein